MPYEKLKKFLDEQHVKYVSIKHSPAYTSPEIAQSAHISGNNFAKTVIVNVDGKLAMVVLPAHQHVDVEMVRKAAKAKEVAIASEQEFVDKFPNCDLGAMPPFGNLYDMDVYVLPGLDEHDQIICNAGTHDEVISLKSSDFFNLVKPIVLT